MSWDWGEIFGSGGLIAGISWLRFREKDEADVTDQLNAVALRQLKDLERRLDKVQRALDRETQRSQRLSDALDAHRSWDIEVLDRLRALGITDIPAPPKLWVAA